MAGPLEPIFQNAVWSFCYLAVLIGLSVYGIHRYAIIYLFLKHRKEAPAPAREFPELPKVTVQLPIFNEVYVVRRLLEAVSKLDYPRELLQIQVLDDSTDETVEIAADECARLKAKGFDISHIHRTNRHGFKAGALQEGMASATGEYLFILDADFVPPPEVLKQSINYLTDPNIGMVQMRWGHLNARQSLLTHLQAMFLDGHLLLEQTARSRSGRFFNFNGTAGIWRKSCIEDAGGWEHDTLTEDLDLSYRAQMKGWKFIFLPDLVIPAELPADINGFKSQQHRWTKGSIQTCKKLFFTIWRSNLPLYVKIEATIHLTSNFGYLLLAALCVLMVPHSVSPGQGTTYFLLVDLPIFLATTVSISIFYIVARRHLNPSGWLTDLLYVPALLALAVGMSLNNAKGVIEAIFNRQSEFTRTPKLGSAPCQRTRRYLPLKSLLPFLEVLFAAFFLLCLWHSVETGGWFSVPFLMIFFGGFLYVALSSLAFWARRLQLFQRDLPDA